MRFYYFPILLISLILIYYLLSKQEGLSLGVFIIMIISGVPFFLVNLSRFFKNKLNRILLIISLVYLLVISFYGFIYLKDDLVLIFSISLLLIILILYEIKTHVKTLIINLLSYLHISIFLAYTLISIK